MTEQKTQLRIITALLLVVIALAGGLLFYIPQFTAEAGGKTPNDTPPVIEPPVHVKQRDAEISLDPMLVFTQTFGGSGDEEIVQIFYENDKLFIFGNTSSSDCDFDKAGAFMARLDVSGKTELFTSYDGELGFTKLYDGGFLMALNGDSPSAIAVDYNGEVINSYKFQTAREENVVDLKYVDSGYLIITELKQEITEFVKLKLTKLDRNLEYAGSIVTDDVYSLEYVDTLDIMDEYMLLANAASQKKAACYGKWGDKLGHFPLSFSYELKGFWITDAFYGLAVTDDATVLIKDDGSIITLGKKADRLNIAGDDGYIYVVADDEFYCVSDKVLFSSQYGETSLCIDDAVYAASSNNGRVFVRSFAGGSKTYEISFNYKMTSPRIFICEKGMFVIGNTAEKFGGNDITVLKIDYMY